MRTLAFGHFEDALFCPENGFLLVETQVLVNGTMILLPKTREASRLELRASVAVLHFPVPTDLETVFAGTFPGSPDTDFFPIPIPVDVQLGPGRTGK